MDGGRECKLSGAIRVVRSELAPESGEKQQSRLAGQQLPPGPLGLLQLLSGERVCCSLIHQQQQSEASGWATAEAGIEEQVEKAAKMGRREGRFPGAPSRAGNKWERNLKWRRLLLLRVCQGSSTRKNLSKVSPACLPACDRNRLLRRHEVSVDTTCFC